MPVYQFQVGRERKSMPSPLVVEKCFRVFSLWPIGLQYGRLLLSQFLPQGPLFLSLRQCLTPSKFGLSVFFSCFFYRL